MTNVVVRDNPEESFHSFYSSPSIIKFMTKRLIAERTYEPFGRVPIRIFGGRKNIDRLCGH
ncbi:MAG: hypothetical protein ACTSR8_08015 [Promethearchaeota archaeon]